MKAQPGERSPDTAGRLLRLAKEDYCYLTTTGRVSGRPHEIEIWFEVQNSTFYFLSGGGEASDWVKNLLANPAASVRIAKHTFAGLARIVSEEKEETKKQLGSAS